MQDPGIDYKLIKTCQRAIEVRSFFNNKSLYCKINELNQCSGYGINTNRSKDYNWLMRNLLCKSSIPGDFTSLFQLLSVQCNL